MGCAMSTMIACLLCNNKCSVSRVASRFAFFPPKPPTYSIEGTLNGWRIVFANAEQQAAANAVAHVSRPVQVEVHYVDTSRGQRVPLLHFVYPGVQTTLLWSHGNAMDIGEMYFFFLQLALELKVNVAAYDYSGYGAATGEPSEANQYADIMAIYNHLTGRGLDAKSHLVLYGQSIGSAPSLWLATRRQVAGIIMHTPILSGLRVLIPPASGFCSIGGCCSPVCVYAACDPFANHKRIKRVTCPVLFVHGTHDTTIDCSHTIQLYGRCPPAWRREPCIVRGAGHDNIVEFDPERYFQAVGSFLRSLDPHALPPALESGS